MPFLLLTVLKFYVLFLARHVEYMLLKFCISGDQFDKHNHVTCFD